MINASNYKLTISYLGWLGLSEEVTLHPVQECFLPDRVPFTVSSGGCFFHFSEDVFDNGSDIYLIELHLKRRFKRNRETGEKKLLGNFGVCEIFCNDCLCASERHYHLVLN